MAPQTPEAFTPGADASPAEARSLGLGAAISRRDFVSLSLIGSGAALLAAPPPAKALGSPPPGDAAAWNGPGGVGDYARSNGNTYEVVGGVHGTRDKQMPVDVEFTGESYDLVVVGGGFSGFSTAYTYRKLNPGAKVLVLDNHAIFGGAAKQNEFEVDGHRLIGPQGSHGIPGPSDLMKKLGLTHPYYEELGLPDPEKFEYAELSGTPKRIRVADNCYMPMHWQWQQADAGWFDMQRKAWAINPWNRGLRDVKTLSPAVRADLLSMATYRMPPDRPDYDRWLDSITYFDFLTKVMGLRPEVADYIDPVAAGTGLGLSSDVVSAYQAYLYGQPGPSAYSRVGGAAFEDLLYLKSFPGGNTGILRHFVKALVPDAIGGGKGLDDVVLGRVNFGALDRADNPVRVRLRAAVTSVREMRADGGAKSVEVVYVTDGKAAKVRGKGVVMATPMHIAKHVVRDLPADYRGAADAFYHAPMLVINVALRNWKFLEKMGISAARRDKGLCWFMSIRRPMVFNGKPVSPFDPAKPIVLTMYIPFPKRGVPGRAQSVMGRAQLLGWSYRDIELQVRREMSEMFAGAGFDARRDIAGLVTNRWGHDYVVTPPGFFFAPEGKKTVSDTLREPFGRIAFAHTELAGVQTWTGAAGEGERAAKQLAS